MSAFVAGRNPVIEALSRRSEHIDKVFVQRDLKSSVLRRIASDADRSGIPVQFVPRQKLDQLVADTPHQGVVAAVTAIGYVDLDDMLSSIAAGLDETRRLQPSLIVLDGIQDPHNLGAILRTAAAADVKGVVLPVAKTAPLNAVVVKASAGTAGMIPIARVRKLVDALTQLKERGFWIVGMSATGTDTVWSLDWKRPVALVVGSEGEGMSRMVSEACDHHVRIPMEDSVESLNVSVATGIALFVGRHLRTTDADG